MRVLMGGQFDFLECMVKAGVMKQSDLRKCRDACFANFEQIETAYFNKPRVQDAKH